MIGKEKVKEEFKRQFDKYDLDYSYFEKTERFMFLSATHSRISVACIEMYPEDWGYTVQIEIPLFIEDDKMDDVSEFIYKFKSYGFELSYKHSRVFYRRTTFCEGGIGDFSIGLWLDLIRLKTFSDRLIDILYSDVTPQQAVDTQSYGLKKTSYEYEHKVEMDLDENEEEFEEFISADEKDICNSIKDYLDDKQLLYSLKILNEDYCFCRFDIEYDLENVFKKINLEISARTGKAFVSCELPVRVKETGSKETAKFLNILNRDLPCRFMFDYSDNSIYCKLCDVYCGGPLSKDFIEITLCCVIDPVEEYGDIINAVANGECTAKEAIERIEQDDEE